MGVIDDLWSTLEAEDAEQEQIKSASTFGEWTIVRWFWYKIPRKRNLGKERIIERRNKDAQLNFNALENIGGRTLQQSWK